MPEPQDESMPATSTPELESGSTNTTLATPENSGAAGSLAHPQPGHQPESATAEPVTLPKTLDLDSLQDLTLYELSELALSLNVRVHADKSRHHLVFDLCKTHLERGCEITATAIVDINAQGGAFLRWGKYNFRPLPQDIQVPYHFDRQFRLQPGLQATVRVRAPRERERFLQVEEFLNIEGIPASEWREPKDFERLTAMHPNARIVLENEQTRSISPRAVDLIAPLGRGQRGLLVAPPRTGKTILLKEIAQAIQNTSPETKLILLLVDERPEEVTDFRRALKCEIYSSTFDENAQRHTQVAEMVLERAKRLVELRHHVVILLDSITRLSRGYNNLQPGKGRIMSGGVDAKALIKPKKFFGAARNTEEGGSLTILATALVETHSKMDDLIFEEFKGTGNMELRLDRTLSEKRVFPAINLPQSGTRRDELLYHPKEFERISALRRQLAGLPAMEATEVLNQALRNTTSNAELLLKGMRA